MLRRIIGMAILCLAPALAAYADGFLRSEIAKRCSATRTNTIVALHQTQTWTMTLRNEGKPCVIGVYMTQVDGGAFGNKAPFENFTVTTQPAHGTLSYRSDSVSYIFYQPNAGFVGIDLFEFRLFPGNGLSTVMVTVGS